VTRIVDRAEERAAPPLLDAGAHLLLVARSVVDALHDVALVRAPLAGALALVLGQLTAVDQAGVVGPILGPGRHNVNVFPGRPATVARWPVPAWQRLPKNTEVQSFLRDTQNRIRSMAMLHEILCRSGIAENHFPRYLRSLCDHLVRSFDSRTIRLRQEISDVALDPDQAIVAGLIVNELVTNAIKHAFPSGSGEILVELRAADEGRVLLRVADDGVGLPSSPPEPTESLGLLLVRSLSRQLNGALTVRGQPSAAFEIVFPSMLREREP
jgi:two-component sensor histidine kinase